MGVKYRLQDVSLLQDRKIFVDANVLIYLFWPTGSYYYERNYAQVFNSLLKQGNDFCVDIFVISEIINRILRTEHNQLQPTKRFKDFRDSVEGKQALSDIHLIIKNNILPRFDIAGKNYNKSEIERFLVVDELDFVDKSTYTICKENSFVLLTNDKDFKNTDLDILTGNPNILS